MTFSIPKVINPIYEYEPHLSFEKTSLNIGGLIKDLSPGAETTMKKSHAVAVQNIKTQHEADCVKFDNDLEAAKIKSLESQKQINDARNKKIIAITSLAATIIGTISLVTAAIVTQTWPILFLATPGLVALVPTSYYTYIFSKKVSELKNDIDAPAKMQKPVLNLPVYDSKKDMELEETRLATQKKLATMSIKQIYNTEISFDKLIGYRLLDGATSINDNKRADFYAKSIQLIKAYGDMKQKHTKYDQIATAELNKLNNELKNWKTKKENEIASQELALNLQRPVVRPRPGEKINVIGQPWKTCLEQIKIDNMKRQVTNDYEAGHQQIVNWRKDIKTSIDNGYTQVETRIESQYRAAITAAA